MLTEGDANYLYVGANVITGPINKKNMHLQHWEIIPCNGKSKEAVVKENDDKKKKAKKEAKKKAAEGDDTE